MFKTGIANIEVLLLKEGEQFLHAKHLDVEHMEEEILLESEIRSSTTSVELSLDHLYKNMNARACEMSRKLIRNTATLLKANLETLYDEHGSPLFYHAAGEVVTLFRCNPTIVQVRSGEERCCSELPI